MITIDIWSDFRCPFCYIGKIRLEKALEKFEHTKEIQINWKAFELDTSIKTNEDLNIVDYLMERKGLSSSKIEQQISQVTSVAKQEDINMDIYKSITANTFKAHQLSYFAQSKGLQSDMERALFRAHFVDGLNIDDKEVLLNLAITVGLDEDEIKVVLKENSFADAVDNDETLAKEIGIQSVPFFIINEKYVVKGAQSTEHFAQIIQDIYNTK